MAIVRELTLTVNNNSASLSEPVYLYRGDRGIELDIKIQKFGYKFGRKTLENMVDDTIVGARAIILGPTHKDHIGERPTLKDPDNLGTCFEISAKNIANNTIIIDVDEQWVDEIHEVGTHTIQIQLYGNAMRDINGRVTNYERITIPPVTFEVLELLCDYEETFTKLGDIDNSQPSKIYGFDSNTNTYRPYEFTTGDIIPYDALNNMEDALVFSVEGIKTEQAVRLTKDNEIIAELNRVESELGERVETNETNIDALSKVFDSINERIDKDIENLKKHNDESIVKFQNAKAYTDEKYNQAKEYSKQGDEKLQESLDKEILTRKEKDTKLEEEIGIERGLRISGDQGLTKRIDTLDSALSNETSSRISNDKSLQASIDAEVTNRTNSDTAIYQTIENLTTIHNNDKSELNNKISLNTANITKEISDRKGAVELLDVKHTNLNEALKTTIDGEIRIAIDDLETTIDNEIKTKINELDQEIEYEVKTSISDLAESVYDKEEIDATIKWLQENIRGPQGTSILNYKGELNDFFELSNVERVEGDSYFIGTEVFIWNGNNWDSVDLRGPIGFTYSPHVNQSTSEEGVKQTILSWSNNSLGGVLPNPDPLNIGGYTYTPHINEELDEHGYTQTFLSWTNDAPKGELINPETVNIKGQPVKVVMSKEEPEDKSYLWVVESNSKNYALIEDIPTQTSQLTNDSNFLTSLSATRIEFVTEYPAIIEEGVLYILVEPLN